MRISFVSTVMPDVSFNILAITDRLPSPQLRAIAGTICATNSGGLPAGRIASSTERASSSALAASRQLKSSSTSGGTYCPLSHSYSVCCCLIAIVGFVLFGVCFENHVAVGIILTQPAVSLGIGNGCQNYYRHRIRKKQHCRWVVKRRGLVMERPSEKDFSDGL